jgi:hypothetical protein
MTLPRDLATATEIHLVAFVEARIPEGTYLDLKRELPRMPDGGRHEFLADVSAFANSSGGDLVYGIEEDGEGRASAIVPQPGNPDEEALRLQDVLMHGIEPRVPGIQIQPIGVAGGFVLAIRVPQSCRRAGPVLIGSERISISSYVRTPASANSTCRRYGASSFVRTTKLNECATSEPKDSGRFLPVKHRTG